jgi:hypothetical protein
VYFHFSLLFLLCAGGLFSFAGYMVDWAVWWSAMTIDLQLFWGFILPAIMFEAGICLAFLLYF